MNPSILQRLYHHVPQCIEIPQYYLVIAGELQVIGTSDTSKCMIIYVYQRIIAKCCLLFCSAFYVYIIPLQPVLIFVYLNKQKYFFASEMAQVAEVIVQTMTCLSSIVNTMLLMGCLVPCVDKLSTAMGLLPYTENCMLRMRRGCRVRFPRHRGLAILTCIRTRAWCTYRDACRDC